MRIRHAWILALSLAPALALGQEAEQPPAEEGGVLQPLPEGEETGAPAPKAGWIWAQAGQLQARLVYEDIGQGLEADHVRGTGAPVNTHEANRLIDYSVRHTSLRLEGAYGLPLGDSICLSLRGGLGWGTSRVTLESRTGSDLSGGGPDFDADLNSRAEFNLGVGADLRIHAGNVFFGGSYSLLYGYGSFDDQLFYTVVEGDMHHLSHDITGVFGVTLGEVLSLWGGLGFVVMDEYIDLDQRGGGDRWDVHLDQGLAIFKGLLGFGLHHGPVAAWAQFEFVPDVSMRFGLAYTLS